MVLDAYHNKTIASQEIRFYENSGFIIFQGRIFVQERLASRAHQETAARADELCLNCYCAHET